MYESMQDEEIAKLMTEQKGIGLADVIYRDLARLEANVEKARSEIGISSQKINPAVNLQG